MLGDDANQGHCSQAWRVTAKKIPREFNGCVEPAECASSIEYEGPQCRHWCAKEPATNYVLRAKNAQRDDVIRRGSNELEESKPRV